MEAAMGRPVKSSVNRSLGGQVTSARSGKFSVPADAESRPWILSFLGVSARTQARCTVIADGFQQKMLASATNDST